MFKDLSKNVIDNKYYIQGVSCESLAKKYGTPLYVYDQSCIENICLAYSDVIKNYYNGNGKICYASKAFCCKEIYRLIERLGLGADVVSSGELYTAKKAKFDGIIIYHGNNKTYSELFYAIKSNVSYVVVDSLSEIDDLEDICDKLNKKVNVLLRINPGVEAHTHHYIQTANIDSKFGFNIENGDAVVALNSILNKNNLIFCGLHSHIGSQIFEAKSFIVAINKLYSFISDVIKSFNIEIKVLDLGGGFGVWYNENDPVFSLDNYANFVKLICSSVKENSIKIGVRLPFLILEPGRSIVAESGTTLYTAGRIKKITDVKNYVSVDGGMFENPRVALYQAKYTVINASNCCSDKKIKYSVAGKCCESGDILLEDCLLPEIKEGQILAFLSTGAYNYSMASNYNRNCIPAVVFVKDGSSRLVVKGQKIKNIVRFDI